MIRRLELKFSKTGMQTTIQDQGRESYKSFGVPQAGPMDTASARIANWLVGNPDSSPVLEVTLIGPVIRLQGEGQIALTGASFEVFLDNQPLPFNTTIDIKGKHQLNIGQAQKGCRCYMAIAGSWKLKPWLNSYSTSPQNSRKLTPDSLIEKESTITVLCDKPAASRSVVRSGIGERSLEQIRVLGGPEYHQFSTPSIKSFLRSTFSITTESNRMGFRLGPQLSGYDSPAEVISSGVVPGTIQVTHSGQLIILMADAQTSGGYPRIANVISADLDKLAQLQPGGQVRFRLVSLADAHEALRI